VVPAQHPKGGLTSTDKNGSAPRRHPHTQFSSSPARAVPQFMSPLPAPVRGGFFLRKNPLGIQGFVTQ